MRNVCLALIIIACLPVTAWAADMYSVNSGATVEINEHGVCQRITNGHATGQAIMVPTRTASEWTTFRGNRPAGVGMAACPSGGAWILRGNIYSTSSGYRCSTQPDGTVVSPSSSESTCNCNGFSVPTTGFTDFYYFSGYGGNNIPATSAVTEICGPIGSCIVIVPEDGPYFEFYLECK